MRMHYVVPLLLFALVVGLSFLGYVYVVDQRASTSKESQSTITASSDFQEIPKLMLPVLAQTLGRDQKSYHMEKDGSNFRSVTVSQDINSEYSLDGVTFSRNNKRITMSLTDAEEISPLKISPNKVEYDRANVKEWYVNSPLGVEQGFTLNMAPEGKKKNQRVIISIDFAMSQGLTAIQTDDKSTINFVEKNSGVDVLRYSGLYAYDSMGKELPSEMKLFGSQIKLSVDDNGAKYPIVIDPFIEIQKIIPSDAMPNSPPSWQFGGTVHISGNTAIVGAIHADGFLGEAYIFDRDDNTGFWSETQILQGSNVNTFGDFFGNCVHIDGDTAIVGASHVLNPATPGEAYIFERDPMTNLWSEVDIISGSTAAAGSFYGISCTLEESTGIAMVGANRAFAVEGRAYVYERDMAGMWNEVQVLTPSGGMPNFQFGFKINFQGDIAAIGAPGLIGFPVGDRVYMYQRDTMTGLWSETQIISGSDTMPGDAFGVDVDFDGDNMVIGASQFNMNEGKAYFFERDPMTNLWSEVDIFTADMPVPGEFFGSNVSISGDLAIVSAALLITSNGRVLVYERDPMGIWSEVQELTASDGMVGDQFGVETSIDGNQLIVGANGVDGAAGPLTGAAYLYGNDIILDVEIIGEGTGVVTSMPVGIDCGSMVNDCTEEYQYQTLVTLTAVPTPGSAFVEWTGDCSGNDPTTSILMLDDSLCIAEFELAEFVLNPIFPALDDNINFISAENAAPGGGVAFLWSKNTGSFTIGGQICNGLEIGLNNPRLLAIVQANQFAVATYIFYIPLFGDFEFEVQLQAVDIENCRVSNIVPQIIRKDESG